MRANARARLGLAESARSINEYLLEYMLNASFVTMFCALIDPRIGLIQYINSTPVTPRV